MPEPISTSNARIGRTYQIADSRGMKLGLQVPPSQTQALDYFSNAAARMGFGTPSLAEATEYELVRFSNDYGLINTLYRNHWISRAIVDTPAKDMVRGWPRLTSDIDPEDITRIDRSIRKSNTKSNVLKALKWARLYGGAGALIIIEGHEDKLDEPLDIETVELGAYRGLIPFDRWSGIYPSGEISIDIDQPMDFNLPLHYTVQSPNGGESLKVHTSRILRFTGPSVPSPENQAQSYWGISSLEPAYEEIRKRDNMSWNILSVSFRASLIGMKFPEMASMLSGAGMNQNALAQFQQRMQAMNHLLSNNSLLLLPKEGGLESVQQNMAGWADIYQQFQLDISGAAGIPVSRLFGRTLTGLGQSNDADEQIYEESIALEQEDQMRPQLDKLYPVICMSELGEVPDDLDLVFPGIRVMSEKEKAELAKTTGDNVIAAVNAGILTRTQGLKELKQSSDVTGVFTNITDEDIAQAERDEELGIGTGEMEGGPGEEPRDVATDSAPIDQEFAGLPVTVEYPKLSRRIIRNPQGKVVYDRNVLHDYGFIRNTVGRDGDEIDMILGPDEDSGSVFIVDMIDLGPDVNRRKDEDKVLLGFRTAKDAERAFLLMYPRSFLGSMRETSIRVFREHVLRHGLVPAA